MHQYPVAPELTTIAPERNGLMQNVEKIQSLFSPEIEEDRDLFMAGYSFVEQNMDTADIPDRHGPAWYGWMVRHAFWAGAKWARENK